jgi:hypothetical protein
MKSKVSPVLFIVTVLCFLLPFITVSCNGQKVATLSGTDLAFGTSIEQPQMFGRPIKQHTDAQPIATIAFLIAIAGIAVGFLAARVPLASAITGGLGALFLLILMGKLSSDVGKQVQGVLQIEYGAGLIMALLLFIAAAGWNGWLFFASRGTPAGAASPPLANAAAANAGGPARAAGAFCPHCGQAVSSGAKFCGGCGNAIG